MHFGVSGQHRGVLEQVGLRLRRVRDLDARASPVIFRVTRNTYTCYHFLHSRIYGFPYIKSAKSVFQLFANRGWDAIVADQLVADTLFLVSIVVGAIMGAVALIIQASTGVLTQGNGHQQNNVNVMAFFLGFIVGLTLCSILMSVIGSGVNAVIVLFAEAPAEFQQNYPDLSNRMRSAWSSVYPGSI